MFEKIKRKKKLANTSNFYRNFCRYLKGTLDNGMRDLNLYHFKPKSAEIKKKKIRKKIKRQIKNIFNKSVREFEEC